MAIIGTMEFGVTPAVSDLHGFAADWGARFACFVRPIVEQFKFPFASWTGAIALALGKSLTELSEQAGKCAVADF